MRNIRLALAMLALAVGWSLTADAVAASAAQIKKLSGSVFVVRDGERRPARIGEHLQQADVIETGEDGSVGIIFADDTLFSAGPGSQVALEKFSFDAATHDGALETRLTRGTLAVQSGKIAKRSADAMKIRTRTTILGVRGTKFVVKAGG